MRKGKGFGRALLVETVATVTAVVLPVGECEGGSTPHTNIGVNPFGGLSSVSIFTVVLQRIENHTALLSIILLATVTRGGNW